MSELEKKKCQVCVGCGRCGKATSGLRVITESFLKPELLPTEISAGKGSFVIVDIGTTTIAMELYDESGKKLDQHVLPNSQRAFGADVISRIQAAENPMFARQMQSLVKTALAEGMRKFYGKAESIEKIYIAANTTMLYLLCGHDTQPLGRAPFQADFLESEELQIEETKAVTLPGFSAFVGGDIMAGVLASGMYKQKEISLLIDLGTNGEMVLGNEKKMLACSTAAGPAFEGMLQAQGKAVWGADIVEYVAGLLEKGIVDETGLLIEPYFTEGITIAGIQITQEHIRSLQTAKAAIAAGVQMLVKKYGLTGAEEIDKVYLAGGFGYYLKEESALTIGVLPEALRGKIQAVGNSALAGCYYYHFAPRALSETKEIRNITKVLNLAELDEFNESFLESMYLRST